MGRKAIALKVASIALAGIAFASVSEPKAAVRAELATVPDCWPIGGVARVVSGRPVVRVNGNEKPRRLKRGDFVRTDKYGVADICLAQNSAWCRLRPKSVIRVLPPRRKDILIRLGKAKLSCGMRDARVIVDHDRNGWYLSNHPPSAKRLASAAGVTGDPLFSIDAAKSQAVVKLKRGAALVAGGKQGAGATVVLGRRQQVTTPASGIPAQPKEIHLTPAENKILGVLGRALPPDTDHQAPHVQFDEQPPERSSIRQPAIFKFSSSEAGVTFSCALDSKDFRLCNQNEQIRIPPPSAGTHTFYVRVTDSSGNARVESATWTIDGSRIVFESFRDGNPELYSEDPDGENQVRLTNNLLSDEHPDWGPDQKRIVFDHLDEKQSLDIWTMNADGTGEARLTTDGADRNPSWSPDGTRIAFEIGPIGHRQIYVMNADGSDKTPLTSDPCPSCPTDNLDPAWAPDSKRIVFASNRGGSLDVYVMNADGSGQTALTNDPTNEFGPSWSPDGKLIAYHSNRGVSQNIYVMSPDGSGGRHVTTSERNDTNPSWAPDSRHLVFASDRDPNAELQLYVVDALSPDEPTRIPAPSTRANFAADW
jgi:Tol biopolymer transport system component